MAPRPRKQPPAEPAPVAGVRRALRVVLVASVLVAAGIGAYVAARTTSMFALDRIEVEGAPPAVANEVRAALRPYLGRSLVGFDPGTAGRRLAQVSAVADAHFDRAFPHTLRISVRVERPVGVLRQGSSAWLVSSTARVLRPLRRPYPRLPRIWLPASAEVRVNETLSGSGAKAVAALAPLGPLHLRAHVTQVRATADELSLVLGSGAELRLGDSGDLRLKLAIATRLLPLTRGARYVDVSVPERPVAGYNPKVAG